MNHIHAMMEAAAAPEQPHWELPTTPIPVPKPPPTWRQRAQAAALRVANAVGVQELQVLAGLVLVGYGCHLLHPAAGYIAPGVVLLWWALPMRPRFVEPKPPNVRVVVPGEQPLKRERE